MGSGHMGSDKQNVRRTRLKHYLPATSLAGVTNESVRLIFSHPPFPFCPFMSTNNVASAALLSVFSSDPDRYMSLNHSDFH